MEEKKDVLRVMKHDLKGPLTIIKGYLSFWENNTYVKFPPEKQKDFVLKALEGANKMERLIEETFQKLQEFKAAGQLKTPDDANP